MNLEQKIEQLERELKLATSVVSVQEQALSMVHDKNQELIKQIAHLEELLRNCDVHVIGRKK